MTDRFLINVMTSYFDSLIWGLALYVDDTISSPNLSPQSNFDQPQIAWAFF